MNDKHAIDALITKTDQKTSFPCFDCFGKGAGIGLIIPLKKLICSNALVSGTSISKETTMLINVNSSLNCHI